MSTHTQFRCDEEIVQMIENANLPLHALRVFYGLHYLIDADPSKHVILMSPPHRNSMTVKGRKIRQATFPSGTNDLKFLPDAQESLLASKLLSVYEIDDQTKTLTFRYSDKAIVASGQKKGGKFAIADSLCLTRLSTPEQIMLYIRTMMHQRMKAPSFYISGISASTPWQSAKKSWVSAAEKLSKELDQQYLFCPEADRMSEQVSAVKVKISNDQSSWFSGSLYYRLADKPPTAVSAGHSGAVTRAELLKRETWTKVGPIPARQPKKCAQEKGTANL